MRFFYAAARAMGHSVRLSTGYRLFRTIGEFLALVGVLMLSTAAGDGALETIRTDVRNPPSAEAASPSEPSPPSEPKPSRPCSAENQPQDPAVEQAKADLFVGAVIGAGVVAASPFWAPRALLGDDNRPGYFPRYPYDHTDGFLLLDDGTEQTDDRIKQLESEKIDLGTDPNTSPYDGLAQFLNRHPPQKNWACQVQADYLDEFDTVSSYGGQVIFDTASRIGFDGSFEHLRERLPGDNFDNLTLGDANLIYRFAQSARILLRTGIGMNWLNDARRTDLGFNFTYGGDFFPHKPWVISAAVDWGTLGHPGLFRFRTTAGILVNRFETYAGYEYCDIGRTQNNFFVAGVRIWF